MIQLPSDPRSDGTPVFSPERPRTPQGLSPDYRLGGPKPGAPGLSPTLSSASPTLRERRGTMDLRVMLRGSKDGSTCSSKSPSKTSPDEDAILRKNSSFDSQVSSLNGCGSQGSLHNGGSLSPPVMTERSNSKDSRARSFTTAASTPSGADE